MATLPTPAMPSQSQGASTPIQPLPPPPAQMPSQALARRPMMNPRQNPMMDPRRAAMMRLLG